MNLIEYGNKNKEVILLLHGGGFSWWNYREAAGILASGPADCTEQSIN